MIDKYICQGEDFALVISSFVDAVGATQNLLDFDIVVNIQTSSLGDKIMATSTPQAGCLQVIRRNSDTIAVNVPHKLTAELTTGVITIDVMLIHKITGIRLIKTFRNHKIESSNLSHYE